MEGPLARYHAVLKAVAGSAGITASDLARVTGLPRSTAHRLATALEEIGYLHQSVPGHYELGPQLDKILLRRLLSSQSAQPFTPALRRLVSELGETAFCAKLDGGQVSIFDAVVPSDRDLAHVYPGLGERPLDRCSSSRAILAFREDAEIEQWLSQNAEGVTVGRSELRDTLDQVRATGYSICDGEIHEGIFSVACPVHLGPIGVVYSIGITGPSARMKIRDIGSLVSTISSAAREVASAITFDLTERAKSRR